MALVWPVQHCPSRVKSGFVGGAFHGARGFGYRGDRFRGGWGRGYGWGRGWGWGWLGLGLGRLGLWLRMAILGCLWGPGWGFGWDPWWYGPYWYPPLPAYYSSIRIMAGLQL